MLISPAYAQAPGAGGGDVLVSLLPIILIFVVFYFLLIRPQQKKVKQHRAMIEAVRRGDRIVTSGGIIGTVTKVISDGEVADRPGYRVKVAPDHQRCSIWASPVRSLNECLKACSISTGSKDQDADDSFSRAATYDFRRSYC